MTGFTVIKIAALVEAGHGPAVITRLKYVLTVNTGDT
jgi:hypothetical protein